MSERPSLACLGFHKLVVAPTGVILEKWENLEEKLTREQLDKLPESYKQSRTECAICWQELRLNNTGDKDGDLSVITLADEGACGHSFHVGCLATWLDQRRAVDDTFTCPVCKDPIVDEWVDKTYNRHRGGRRLHEYGPLRGAPPRPLNRRPGRDTWQRLLALTIEETQALMRLPIDQLRRAGEAGEALYQMRQRDVTWTQTLRRLFFGERIE